MRNATKIIMVLDRSGSMSSVKTSMEEVINGYIENQKEQPGECLFSLYQFDNKWENVISDRPIKEVGNIALAPRGATALLDAIGFTIDAEGKALANLPEHERPNKVLVVIVTDGFENASTKYNSTPPQPKATRINEMVSHQRDAYSWTFLFLGADQDAMTTAAGMGIDPSQALNYGNTRGDIQGVGTRLICATSAYRMSDSAAEGEVKARGLMSKHSNKVCRQDTEEWERQQAEKKAKAAPTVAVKVDVNP